MRLTRLRFKNINSLVNEWQIDFTAAPYETDGIFAITGPTGAGKSTLLDAVCLALYGRTPRLKMISKTTNELMSRQTADCFAEVEFEIDSGRYRCHWSQRRAHKKIDGRLQDARHEISDAGSGRIIESNKRRVEAKVIQITGLDFDRFTRSMLLAQGGFSAFLSASADERAPILEQLTGTGIYSDISKQVHERYRDAKEALEIIRAGLGSIRILSHEDEQSLNRTLKQKEEEKKAIQKQEKDLNLLLQWRQAMQGLEQEIETICSEQKLAQEEKAQFEPETVRLENAKKAARLEPDFIGLEALRAEIKENHQAFLNLEKQKPLLEQGLSDITNQLGAAHQNFSRARKTFNSERQILKTVRSQDVRLGQLEKSIDDIKNDIGRLQKQIQEQQKIYKATQQTQKELEKKIKADQAFLQENEKDRELLQILSGLKEKITFLTGLDQKQKDIAKALSKKENGLKQLVKKENRLAKEAAKAKKNHETAQAAIEMLETDLAKQLNGHLLREWRKDYEHALKEQAYQQKIQSLTAHRQQLKKGEACPLCGSLEHPFADELVFEDDDALKEKIERIRHLIGEAESLEDRIAKNRKEKDLLAIGHADIQKGWSAAELKTQQGQTELAALKQTLDAIKEEKEDRYDQIVQQLGEHISLSGARTDPVQLVETLEKRSAQYQDRLKARQKSDERINDSRIKMEGLLTRISGFHDQLSQNQSAQKKLKAEKEKLDRERTTLYGRKDPDIEEARLEKDLGTAEAGCNRLGRKKEQLNLELEKCKHEAQTLQKALSRQKETLKEKDQEFKQKLEKEKIRDEAVFLSFRIPPLDLEKLEEKQKQIETRVRDITIKHRDLQEKLAALKAEKKTRLDINRLTEKLEGIKESIQGLDEQTGGLKQQLFDNQEAKKRFKSESERLEKATCHWQRLGNLHDLIGSADGKKYRNFAQGLTFERMVRHANQSLSRMTDRYLLLRDNTEPLELSVLDNYQAGEIRSVKNLSGGESFIVSLSLALGLSKMAGQNIRVDCLFLDEGFGTLDETALETALEALSGLHREGKLIGIISHLPAIKERIPTRIQIKPVFGGKSEIQGPGCRKLNDA